MHELDRRYRELQPLVDLPETRRQLLGLLIDIEFVSDTSERFPLRPFLQRTLHFPGCHLQRLHALTRPRSAIFDDAPEVDAATAILVAVANGAGLLRFVFDTKELRTRKDRIAQIANGDLSGEATKAAVDAMRAAIMVAVMIPAITTAAIS